LEEGIQFVYIGNVPGSGAENTRCHQCGETAIERKGYIILNNNIKDGKCGSCDGTIPGRWE
jgi:pyruvate formate lyase activating enzyme